MDSENPDKLPEAELRGPDLHWQSVLWTLPMDRSVCFA